MKKLSLFIALATSIASTAMAQQFQFAGFQDVESAFADQQTRMAQLEAQLAAFQGAVAEPVQDVVGVQGCCEPCCSSEWFARFDAVITKFHMSGHGVRTSAAPSPSRSASFDYDLAPRFVLGYQSCDGLGVRANYWYYDDNAPTNGGFVSIRAQTIDLEVFQTLDFSDCVSVEAFGGIRYSDLTQRDDLGLDYGIDGIGLTGGAEVARLLGCNHRLYLRGRLSFLTGNGELTENGSLYDEPATYSDDIVTQTELAAGWDGARCLGNGSVLTYGIGAEYQLWSDAVIAGDASREANFYDAGWAGFVARVGWRR